MEPKPPELQGMVLNERLFVTGLTDAFDAAVRLRNEARLGEILRRVGLSDQEVRDWISGCWEGTYWQHVLPEKLIEHMIKSEFEDAIRRRDANEVVRLFCQMGATPECAKHHVASYLDHYFKNYR